MVGVNKENANKGPSLGSTNEVEPLKSEISPYKPIYMPTDRCCQLKAQIAN